MNAYFRYLDALRLVELDLTLERWGHLFHGSRVLEIGSGSGVQFKRLQQVCSSVSGVEIEGSIYADRRPADVLEYDGVHLPFGDSTFDVIYSSNVIEHCRDVRLIRDEMRRVLRPGGVGIHLIPSHFWRLWSHLTHYPALPKKIARYRASRRQSEGVGTAGHSGWARRVGSVLMDPRHGEYGNRITEIREFHPSQWRKRFSDWGWSTVESAPGQIFYTGSALLAEHWSFESRCRWSSVLGSACYIYVVEPIAAT